MNRQHRRKAEREYAKLYNRAERRVKTLAEKPQKRSHKEILGKICFPTFVLVCDKTIKQHEIQCDIRGFADSIKEQDQILPPRMIFIQIIGEHSYDSDEALEKVCQTILNKASPYNLYHVIFETLQDFGLKNCTRERASELSDKLLNQYVMENKEDIQEGFNVLADRLTQLYEKEKEVMGEIP